VQTQAPGAPRSVTAAGLALFGYVALVLVAAWPLTTRIASTLPGDPAHDTGVYVWNQWVFRHELVERGSSPLYTSRILAPGPHVDLALHNYTIFQNLIALPLQPWIGVVAAFNVTWLLMQALSGWGVFLLARRVTRRDTVAWLAGVLFACSPALIARSTAHQSLVAAAPLAFFLYFVLRAADTRRVRDAVLAGATAAWAATCDAYFGIYCMLLLAVVAWVRVAEWKPHGGEARRDPAGSVITVMMLVPILLIVSELVTGGWRITVLGLKVSVRTLYAPMLVLTVLVAVRVLLALRSRGRWTMRIHREDRARLLQLFAGVVVCAALLSPLLVTARTRLAAGGTLQPAAPWRSSAPGVDLAALLLPNPNHPLAPAALRGFTADMPGGFAENVASLPSVALIVILIAIGRGVPWPRLWLWQALVCLLLAIGPFVVVAQVNTFIPGPWALLRYLPILGAARMPGRFLIPALIAFAVLFAWALEHVGRRRAVTVGVAALLAFELLPVPRITASAHVPDVYLTIAADPRDGSVLEIPLGIWDGTSQTGFPNTATQFFQTTHGKRLFGGYLSRVPRHLLRRQLSYPAIETVIRLSEGQVVDEELMYAAREDAPRLAREASLLYVVIDPRLATPGAREWVIDLFALDLVMAADGRELYRPRVSDAGD
jgi:hypothetical protein